MELVFLIDNPRDSPSFQAILNLVFTRIVCMLYAVRGIRCDD